MNENWFGHFNHWERERRYMMASPQPTQPKKSGQIVTASKFGDVTGDGFIDSIFLTATKEADSEFLRNITLIIRDGYSNSFQTFQLSENAGYNPTIWLGDLTGDKVNDILIQIDSGGSGAVIYAYVYSWQNGSMKKIFDSIEFNGQHPYHVDYANDFKANVTSVNPHKKYVLDLMYKGQEYLDEIYNSKGTLKQPIEGWVDPISGLYPVDLGRNERYSLLSMQQIAGRFHADRLGYVENLLTWNGKEFNIDPQAVCVYGETLN